MTLAQRKEKSEIDLDKQLKTHLQVTYGMSKRAIRFDKVSRIVKNEILLAENNTSLALKLLPHFSILEKSAVQFSQECYDKIWESV